jgi:hypothetical protein
MITSDNGLTTSSTQLADSNIVKSVQYTQAQTNHRTMGELALAYRVRIGRVLRGVTAWIYWCISQNVADGPNAYNQQVDQRYYYVTGRPAVSENFCERGQDQMNHFSILESLPFGALCNKSPLCETEKRHLGLNLHWPLLWSASLCYLFQNIKLLRGLITREGKLNERWWAILEMNRMNQIHEDYKLVHAFLKFYGGILMCELNIKYEIHSDFQDFTKNAIQELERKWEADKNRRMKKDRPADYYTRSDEFNDRMALVTGEFIGTSYSGLVKRLFGDVQTMLRDRRRPTGIIRAPNPVDVRVKTRFVATRITEQRRKLLGEIVHWSPWELTYKNHIIAMQWAFVSFKFDKEPHRLRSTIEEIFDIGFRSFVQRGYSLVSSWDDTLPSTIEDWWCMETESLFAATLVDVLGTYYEGYTSSHYNKTRYITFDMKRPRPTYHDPLPASILHTRRMSAGPIDNFIKNRICGDIEILLYKTLNADNYIPLETQRQIFEAMLKVEYENALPVNEIENIHRDMRSTTMTSSEGRSLKEEPLVSTSSSSSQTVDLATQHNVPLQKDFDSATEFQNLSTEYMEGNTLSKQIEKNPVFEDLETPSPPEKLSTGLVSSFQTT